MTYTDEEIAAMLPGKSARDAPARAIVRQLLRERDEAREELHRDVAAFTEGFDARGGPYPDESDGRSWMDVERAQMGWLWAHGDSLRAQLATHRKALEAFVRAFEAEFVAGNLIVGGPGEVWGPLVPLYEAFDAALRGEARAQALADRKSQTENAALLEWSTDIGALCDYREPVLVGLRVRSSFGRRSDWHVYLARVNEDDYNLECPSSGDAIGWEIQHVEAWRPVDISAPAAPSIRALAALDQEPEESK